MREPESRRHGAVSALSAAFIALLLGGCGTGSDLPSSGTGASAGSADGKTVLVVMQSLDFSPLAVKARVGQTVTWRNEDQAPHNVTYVSGPEFRSSPRRMQIGDQFSIKLTQAGTIHYVCTLHPWMQATIAVSR